MRSVVGSAPLLSANGILLGEEIESVGQRDLRQLDFGDDPAEFRSWLRPTVGGRPHVLVIIETKTARLDVDPNSAAQEQSAIDRGWRVVETVRLPDGGRVSILLPGS